MRAAFTLSVAAIVALGVAAPASFHSHVLHERQDLGHLTNEQWTRRGPVPPGRVLPVRIGLTQSNLDKGDVLLMEVYVLLVY